MAKCECGARIAWGMTTEGKRMPLDPVPVPNGNIILVDGAIKVLTKKEIERIENPGMLDGPTPDRFTSHFATCPKSKHFRRCDTCHHTPCQCKTADG